MPNFGPSDPLQCFNPDLYASFEACSKEPLRCIAPTIKKARCRIQISREDRDEATKVLKRAQELSDSDERDDLIAEFILLHCCHRHNWRLKADDTACWDNIVKSYGLSIGVVQQVSTIEKTATQNIQVKEIQQIDELVGIVHVAPIVSAPEASMGMTLRSGTTIDRPIPRRYCAPLAYFIPFEPEPGESILRQLLADVDEDWPEEGEVYSYVWPQHPDFVKIGYSAWSALDRVRDWQVCNPGATLSKLVSVEYPKTVERLIHLELIQHRFRIAICRTCRHSHEEWFKLPIEKVNQIISDWKELIRRESLYNDDRKLTQEWRLRLLKLNGGAVTARVLLDMLDTEEQSTQEPEQEVTEVGEAISRINLSPSST